MQLIQLTTYVLTKGCIYDRFYKYAILAKVVIMKLTKEQIKKLKKLDIVKATQDARIESSQILNDQGFAALSVVVSHFIADIAEHPEKLIEEFAH
jgi:hypothetical protein